MDPHPANTPLLPLKVLEIILTQIYLSSLVELEENSLKAYGSGSESRHYCSLAQPCSSARPFMSSFGDLRLVCRDWDRAFVCVKRAHPFFQRLEDAFYPYPWHINSKVRSCSISGRYRVFGTFQASSSAFITFLISPSSHLRREIERSVTSPFPRSRRILSARLLRIGRMQCIP